MPPFWEQEEQMPSWDVISRGPGLCHSRSSARLMSCVWNTLTRWECPSLYLEGIELSLIHSPGLLCVGMEVVVSRHYFILP